MKFLVTKTSDWGDNQPCEESFDGEYIYIDERTVNDPSQLKYKNAEKEWYGNGSNHRVENNHIKRDFNKNGWLLEVNSIEQLINFVNKYGDIVISNHFGTPEIEIYDTYRE